MVLAEMVLAERVCRLDAGERTVLKRGGEPLNPAERARPQLARATYGRPSLLHVNHLEQDMDAGGKALLSRVLRSYRGTAILASDQPQALLDRLESWHPAQAAGYSTAPGR